MNTKCSSVCDALGYLLGINPLFEIETDVAVSHRLSRSQLSIFYSARGSNCAQVIMFNRENPDAEVMHLKRCFIIIQIV